MYVSGLGGNEPRPHSGTLVGYVAENTHIVVDASPTSALQTMYPR